MVNITDSLKAPAILVGEDYTVEYANPAFGEFCGRPPEELLGKKCHKVSHASDSPCRLNGNDCPLKYVLRTGKSTRVRHRHVCVNGSEKVFDILAIPVSLNGKEGRGKILEIMVEADGGIESMDGRYSEDFLGAVLDGIGEGVVVISSDLRIIRANNHYQRMSGMSGDEIKGEHCYWASHRYDVPCFEKGEQCPVIGAFSKGIRQSGTHIHYDKDGRPIHVELNAFPLRDRKTGKVISVIETINDISDKVALKRQLLSSESKYRELYNQTPVMLFTMNEEGIITECNRTMAEKLETTKENLRGMLFMELLTDESKTLIEEKKKLCKTGEFCVFEVEMLTRNRRLLPVKLTGKQSHEKEGGYYSFIGIDLTELKKAEEEKRLLEAQLLQAQKMESIGTLSAGIAHDFNNLLTGLFGYVELLGKQNLPGLAKDYLNKVNELLNVASNLTGQLLVVGRKAEAEYQVMDITHFLQEFLSTINRIIGDEIEIRHTLLAESIFILGDPAQLYQMLMNLFINARDAMPDGGVIHVKTDITDPTSGTGIYSNTDTNRYVLISVKDTGTGIPESIINRIFDPFFTTKTDRSRKGTGLGLSVVYSIIRAHKGLVEVKSRENEGTEFLVYLPITEGRPDASGKDSADSTSGKTEGATVLVVDDEEIVIDVVVTVLKENGMNVLTARDGREALRVFQDHAGKIDLVIIDKSMPRLDGIKTFQELRKLDPNVRAVLSTGFSDEKAEDFIKMGFAGCLKKPYRINDILKVVKDNL